jgi:hypothetical protein
MHCETIPTRAGHCGVSNRIVRHIYLKKMLPFILNFDLVKRKEYLVKYKTNKYPYTGKEYYQMVWRFDDINTFEAFTSSFVNFKPSYDIIWLFDFHQETYFLRFDNPSKTEHSYLVKTDKESSKKQRKYCKKNLPSGVGLQTRLRVVVGDIPHNKKRKSYAKLVYTINQEPDPSEGELKLCIYYEITKGGAIMGGRVEGEKQETEEEEEEKKDQCISDQFSKENYSKEKLSINLGFCEDGTIQKKN